MSWRWSVIIADARDYNSIKRLPVRPRLLLAPLKPARHTSVTYVNDVCGFIISSYLSLSGFQLLASSLAYD